MGYDDRDWGRRNLGPTSYGSVLERRDLIWNDDNIADGTVPDDFYTEEIYKGKFFTRGCRGMIEQLQIYCIRTAAGTLTLRYSPHPCLGPVRTVTVTPGAAWAWVDVDIERMWDYDSLFIWVHECSADVSWAYDAVLPYDGHVYYVLGIPPEDLGRTWEDMAIRPFIRAVYSGETPGDVPVSGIINNIPLPSVSTLVAEASKSVPEDEATVIVDVHGAGYCDYIEARVFAAVGSESTYIRVYCDGVLSGHWSYGTLNLLGHTTSTPTVSLSTYLVDGLCHMLIHKRFEFLRRLRVDANNAIGPVIVSVSVYPTLLR